MIVFLGVTFALFILAIIVWMLLSKRLREKYAILWLIIGIGMLVLTVFPDLLVWLSNVLGVQVPSNLLFVGALALLVGVTLHQSWELSTAEDETRRVAEEVAILRAEVDALKDRAADTDISTDGDRRN
ncbi:DUF2304 domain-containing protein [Microbacterium sp. NPDC087665]|uniref:DUF2304 domain-containing protein n=1 Tax=Microbacterium sp. NPDC087665 TaxID=3364194 RepID=UPI00381127E1